MALSAAKSAEAIHALALGTLQFRQSVAGIAGRAVAVWPRTAADTAWLSHGILQCCFIYHLCLLKQGIRLAGCESNKDPEARNALRA